MDSLEQSEELRDSDRLDSAALLDVQVNYPPLSHRMLVLTCILVFEFFRNMAVQSIVLWVPMTLALNVYFFSQTNQDIDFEGYRLNRFLYVQVTLLFHSHLMVNFAGPVMLRHQPTNKARNCSKFLLAVCYHDHVLIATTHNGLPENL